MNTRKIVMLLVVALALLGLAKLTSVRNRPVTSGRLDKPVLAGLDVNAVRAIDIRKGGEALRLARQESAWVVTNAHGYPADFAKVRQNLIAIKDLKIGDVQRGMRLEGPEVITVDLQGDAGKSLATLRLGSQRQRQGGDEMGFSMPGEGRYVATGQSDEAYLVKDSLTSFTPDAKSWMDTQLLSIPAADIEKIELAGAGETVTLDRSSGTLRLEGINDAAEEFDTSKSYGVESALNYLRFEEIAPPSLTPEQTGIVTGRTFRATLKNGEIYTASVGAAADGASGRYARFAAELKPATTNDAARAQQERRVAELSRTLSPWTFVISSYAAENLTRSRADLVKPKPAATNSVEAAAATNATGQAGTPAVVNP